MTPTTTKTDGREQEKLFAQRRAGLLPQDAAADERFLDLLVVVELDPARPPGPPRFLPPRPLTEAEREGVKEGRLVGRGVEIVRAEAWAERQARPLALERSRAMMRAERAEREARRAAAEAKKWRENA